MGLSEIYDYVLWLFCYGAVVWIYPVSELSGVDCKIIVLLVSTIKLLLTVIYN